MNDKTSLAGNIEVLILVLGLAVFLALVFGCFARISKKYKRLNLLINKLR
jgi:hypothetical protein